MSKAPYTFPHRSRKAMADYLTDVGGYSRHHASYPLEFDVAAYVDLTLDHLLAVAKEHGMIPAEFGEGTRAGSLLLDALNRTYKRIGGYLWNWSLEDAQNGVTDDDHYTTLFDTGESVDAEWAFVGRCGKHLVLTKLLGYSLEGVTAREFDDMLRGQCNPNGYELDEVYPTLKRDHSWLVPTDKLRKMYRFVRQCEADLTQDAAEREVEYHAASRLTSEAIDLYHTLYGGDKKRTDALLQDDALRVLDALGDSNTETLLGFRRLCTAAGVDISELVEDHEPCTN